MKILSLWENIGNQVNIGIAVSNGSPATHLTLYHQGDCDEHDQCAVGLHCGVDNCQGDETGEADCCKPKSCVLGDPWKTRPDWDCCRSLNDHQFSLLLSHHLALFKINPFSLVTSAFSCCCTTKLTNDCSSPDAPCSEGEGDCEVDADCQGSLRCGYNNCGDNDPTGVGSRVSQKKQKSEFCYATNPSGFHRLDEPPKKNSAL